MNVKEEIKGFQKKELTGTDINELLASRRQILEENKKKDIIDKKKTMQLESMIEISRKELDIKNKEIEQKNNDIIELKQQLRQSNQDKEKLVKKIIALLDQFDNIYDFSVASGDSKWINNMNSVMKVVDTTLREIGINEVPALDEVFNENYHECVEVIEDITKKRNEVIKIYKKGYIFNSKVIRYASVATVK